MHVRVASVFVVATLHVGSGEPRTAADEEDCDALKYAQDSNPGFFPVQWVPCELLRIEAHAGHTKMFTFGLPSHRSLNLPVVSSVNMLLQGAELDGSDATQSVYPVSENWEQGEFSVLAEAGGPSIASDRNNRFMFMLKKGDEVSFRQTATDIRRQYKNPPHGFGPTSITMVAAGGCVAGYLQAIRQIFQDGSRDTTSVTLLYGSATPETILLMPELTVMAKKFPKRLKIILVVGETRIERPDDWVVTREREGLSRGMLIRERGWIDEEKIHQYGFPPGGFFSSRGIPTPDGWGGAELWLCGPPSMVCAVCAGTLPPCKIHAVCRSAARGHTGEGGTGTETPSL